MQSNFFIFSQLVPPVEKEKHLFKGWGAGGPKSKSDKFGKVEFFLHALVETVFLNLQKGDGSTNLTAGRNFLWVKNG